VGVRTASTMTWSPRSRTAVITPLVAIWRPAAVTFAVPLALRPGPVLPRGPGPVTGSAARRCPSRAPRGAARGVPVGGAPVGRPGAVGRRGARAAAELTCGRSPARAAELATGRGPPAANPAITIGGITRRVPARARRAIGRACSRRGGARRARRPARPVGRRTPRHPGRRSRGASRSSIAASPRALTRTTGTLATGGGGPTFPVAG